MLNITNYSPIFARFYLSFRRLQTVKNLGSVPSNKQKLTIGVIWILKLTRGDLHVFVSYLYLWILEFYYYYNSEFFTNDTQQSNINLPA